MKTLVLFIGSCTLCLSLQAQEVEKSTVRDRSDANVVVISAVNAVPVSEAGTPAEHQKVVTADPVDKQMVVVTNAAAIPLDDYVPNDEDKGTQTMGISDGPSTVQMVVLPPKNAIPLRPVTEEK